MNSTGLSGTVPLIKCEDASPLDGDGPAPAPGGSYNLSVNVNLSAAVSNLLAAETGGNTPRTPEILNSLIAMSNPLEQYNYSDKTADSGSKVNQHVVLFQRKRYTTFTGKFKTTGLKRPH